MKSTKIKYEMKIVWSEEDDCYLVGFPDFLSQKWRTHGDIATAKAVKTLFSRYARSRHVENQTDYDIYESDF